MGNTSRVQYVATGVFVCLVIMASLYIEQSFLGAFVWGIILSITAFPLYQVLRRRGCGNMVASLVISVGIFALLAVPLVAMVAKAVADLPSLYDWAKSASQTGIPVPKQVADLPGGSSKIAPLWQKYLSDPNELRTWLGSVSHTFATADGKNLTHRLMEVAETFMIAVLSVYFFLVSAESLIGDIRAVGKKFLGRRATDAIDNIVGSVRGTVAGLVLVGMGEGGIIGIGYFMAGTPHPALFMLVTAIVSIVPFCGPVILALAAATTFAASGGGAALIVGLIGCMAYFFGDHFVRPKLISGNTKIPFLAVLTAILGGLHACGLLGLFIGPAVIAVAFSLWRSAVADSRADCAAS